MNPKLAVFITFLGAYTVGASQDEESTTISSPHFSSCCHYRREKQSFSVWVISWFCLVLHILWHQRWGWKLYQQWDVLWSTIWEGDSVLCICWSSDVAGTSRREAWRCTMAIEASTYGSNCTSLAVDTPTIGILVSQDRSSIWLHPRQARYPLLLELISSPFVRTPPGTMVTGSWVAILSTFRLLFGKWSASRSHELLWLWSNTFAYRQLYALWAT